MGSICYNCGVDSPYAQLGTDLNTRCKPCKQYFEFHQPNQATERPWYLWDTADAIARDLLPQFHTYSRQNPGDNPSIRPHQAGKLCQAGCGNLGVAKRASSHCKTCKHHHKKNGITLPRTWAWLQSWSEKFDRSEIIAKALHFREAQSIDPNEYYQLGLGFSEQSLAYYHCGYTAAFGATKIDGLRSIEVKNPRESKPGGRTSLGSEQADPFVISSDDEGHDAVVEEPNRTSRPRLRERMAAVPSKQDTLQDEDGSDSLVSGSLIYGQHSIPTKRKRPKFQVGSDSDYDPFESASDASPRQSLSTPSILSGASSLSTLTTPSLASTATASSKKSIGKRPATSTSVAPKAAASRSDSQHRVSVNPKFSFTNISGDVQKVMEDLLPEIQQAIAKYTITAIADVEHASEKKSVSSTAATSGSTTCDNAAQTDFSSTDAGIQAVPEVSYRAVSTMTSAAQSTHDSSVQVGHATTHAAVQTLSTTVSVSNKKRRLDITVKPKSVLKAQTVGLRSRTEEDSDDELNDSMGMF